MQTIVNLVSGGLGVAWVPESVTQFQRAGVVYRAAAEFAPRRGAEAAACRLRNQPGLARCDADDPALARFVRIRARGRARGVTLRCAQ